MPNPKVPPGLKLLRTDEISGTTPAGRKPPTVAKLPRVVPPVPSSSAPTRSRLPSGAA